ncbi:MAG: GNAT family N-acetyltransferase [Bacteroidales bacterium]|nr:GNAT family N-acetyltransferase [Bacteroidales bacterium]
MIETERLIIRPLTGNQLDSYMRCDNSLEIELNLNLNLNPSQRTIPAELQEALEQVILPAVADKEKNYLFSTLWTMILKTENRMTGDLCFYGEPNPEGEIEIGYGTYDEFQNLGLMTEALSGMIRWVQTCPNVLAITASTEKTNPASFRVLEKNNFIKVGETETMWKWRRVVRNS